jgi:hypothetical protein
MSCEWNRAWPAHRKQSSTIVPTSVTVLFLEHFCWKCLTHPPCSPDLAQSNFHFFGPLKKHCKGKFKHDGGTKAKVCWCIQRLNLDFFSAGINRWCTAKTGVLIALAVVWRKGGLFIIYCFFDIYVKVIRTSIMCFCMLLIEHSS